jgi:hypothetical protein
MLNSQDNEITMEAITLIEGVAKSEMMGAYKVILTTPYSFSNGNHGKYDLATHPAIRLFGLRY